MSYLDDRKTQYMNRMLGFVIMFAALGSVVLICAVNYLSSTVTNALKYTPPSE